MFIPKKSSPTPIYETEPNTRFGSVNAGDNALYVGGFGINGAFSKTLKDSELYTDLHTEAIKLAEKSGYGTTIEVPICEKFVPSVQKCYARIGPGIHDKTISCTILSIFKLNDRPFNSKNNMAMIYTVGPRGSKITDPKEFLIYCHAVGSNIKEIITDYNRINKQETIQTIRMCLVSGGAYKHKQLSKIQVAQALMDGLGQIPQVTIEYAYDDNAFQLAKAAPTPI